MRLSVRVVVFSVLVSALAAACGSSSSSTSTPAASSATTQTTTPSTATATTTPTGLPAACTKTQLHTNTPSVLTVATDNPVFPPYFVNNKPANGQGFESAVAYAVGQELGYAKSDLKWTTETFNASYAPGSKQFDFDINEVSITAARQQAVDFSSPYYTAPQAVLVIKGSKFAHATSLAALKSATLGVQIGTTSLQAVQTNIKPSSQPKVFNNSTDVVTALKNHLVDGIVTDLPTALYISTAQVPSSVIVGQFSAPGGDTWGLLLAKSSPLTQCVTAAVDALRTNGKLAALTSKWMSAAAGAPVLK